MERQVWVGFAKAILVTFAGAAAIGFLSVPGSFRQSLAKTWAYQPPPAPQHDCSGAMKDAMAHNPELAARRHELCDLGQEAAVEEMIVERQKEYNRPAF